jgi:hypothetical protein
MNLPAYANPTPPADPVMTTPLPDMAARAVFAAAALRAAGRARTVVGGVNARQSGATASRKKDAMDFMVAVFEERRMRDDIESIGKKAHCGEDL